MTTASHISRSDSTIREYSGTANVKQDVCRQVSLAAAPPSRTYRVDWNNEDDPGERLLKLGSSVVDKVLVNVEHRNQARHERSKERQGDPQLGET